MAFDCKLLLLYESESALFDLAGHTHSSDILHRNHHGKEFAKGQKVPAGGVFGDQSRDAGCI